VVTATRQAEHLLPGPFKARVYRPQGWLSPVLLVGGRMEGVWRHEVKGRRVQVVIEPFAGPPPAWARRAAEAEAERLAAFARGQLELAWTDT
jgi:Winged helix DNA-binding domain